MATILEQYRKRQNEIREQIATKSVRKVRFATDLSAITLTQRVCA